jgi:hypothetical protein
MGPSEDPELYGVLDGPVVGMHLDIKGLVALLLELVYIRRSCVRPNFYLPSLAATEGAGP